MSRESKLAKNTFIIALGSFVPKFASIITLPLLTAYLSKSEYGTYDLITIMVSLFLPSVTLQIQTAAFRFLVDVRENEEGQKTIITNTFFFGITTSVVSLLVLFFVLSWQPLPERFLICLFYLADNTENTLREICRGFEKNGTYSISAIISAFSKLFFVIIFVYQMQAALLGTIWALLLSSVISVCYLIIRTRVFRFISIRYFSTPKLKEMLSYSWPMVPNSMSLWVMQLSDRLVVTIVMGVAAEAVYAVANKIPSLLQLALNTFSIAWQENASVASKDEDAEEYYSAMFRTMFDLMAGFFGVLIAATPLLFMLLIIGDYSDAYVHIPILIYAFFFFSLASFLGGIYVAYKKSKSVGITTTIAAVINLGIDVCLIRFIGIYAASISTLVGFAFLFVFRMLDIQKIVRIKYNIGYMSAIMLIMVLESVLCFLQRPELNIINVVLGMILFITLNRKLLMAVSRKIKHRINPKAKGDS